MLTKWRQRIAEVRKYAAQGKGVPIPYSGKSRYKPAPKWTDEIGDNWRRWWRAKNLAKMNNRDERAKFGAD